MNESDNISNRVYNPITKNCYTVRTKTSEYGKRGEIKGLWNLKKV